ncbi:glycoside hydrolase [Sarocladium strictum]
MKTSQVALLYSTAELANAATLSKRLDNGLGLTPSMGWSGWNVAQCESASEKYALDTANAFVSLGLKDLGYEYVNIDDCWTVKDRRDDTGHLIPDPDKWPRGMKAVADDIHDLGLKFGLYGCAGKLTCASYPGSEGYEQQDAESLAEWTVDFWKYDNCYTPCKDGDNIQVCGSPDPTTKEWYGRMRDAIVGVQGTYNILFNMCSWGVENVWEWGEPYGNSWRIDHDNWQDWESVQRIGSRAAKIWDYSAPGGFNDLDMLVVGNDVLTENQEKLHFGLWAIAKSPLILGTDMTTISESTLAIISNKGIIDINQDSLGVAATTFQPPGAPAPVDGEIYTYWAGPLSDGVAVGLTSVGSASTISVNFADVPGLGEGTFEWEEMYSGQTGSGDSASFGLGQDDMAVLKVTSSSK